MTIAIGLKVGDGIVLGADSAWTLSDPNGNIQNVYFNAEKVANLVKGLPVGCVVYGLGGFAGRSITRHAKDLRSRLCGADPHHADWTVNPETYTIEGIAKRLREFFYEELYLAEHPPGSASQPNMGFIIGGYSAGQRSGELWQVQIESGACGRPTPVWGVGDSDGIVFGGQPEALYRLVRGWSTALVTDAAAASGQPQGDVAGQFDRVAQLWGAAMPIQDTIDLVRYLIDVTIGFVRFSPGWPTVAGPIDLAAITLHEGFLWVQRKHYYEPSLNSGIDSTDLLYTQNKGTHVSGLGISINSEDSSTSPATDSSVGQRGTDAAKPITENLTGSGEGDSAGETEVEA